MTNIMNTHFANVRKVLAVKLPKVPFVYDSHIHLPIFGASETTDETVRNIIGKLSPSKSCRDDGITARHVKDAGDTIIAPLTFIYNLSIKTKLFPLTGK